jgi:hypothetical protein
MSPFFNVLLFNFYIFIIICLLCIIIVFLTNYEKESVIDNCSWVFAAIVILSLVRYGYMYNCRKKKDFTMCEFVGGKQEISGGGFFDDITDRFTDFLDDIRTLVSLPSNKDTETSEDIPDDKKTSIQKIVNLMIPFVKNKKSNWDKLRGNLKNINNTTNLNNGIEDDVEEYEEIFHWEKSLLKFGPSSENIIVPKNTFNTSNNGSDNFSKFITDRKLL